MMALDTLDSIRHYCPMPHDIVIVDDCTNDGTYETLVSKKQAHWHFLRNECRHGTRRLVHSLSAGFRCVLRSLNADLVLRMDQDALLINQGIAEDAFAYVRNDPAIGIFGVYKVDYNRPRSYEVHRRLIDKELRSVRAFAGLTPSWRHLLQMAEANGYRRGDNVFGGAYFITRSCLTDISKLGALDPPYHWHSRMEEDVYFSMAAVAAGHKMGHFAAPDGPLCLEWRGLPYPASELWCRGYKLVHSVDKGINTGKEENQGLTAREVFRRIRYADKSAG